MAAARKLPTNLLEAARYFEDPDVAVEFVAKLRWPEGPVCPRCEGTEHSYLTTRRVWKCKACKKQFTVKLGTIFEDSPIPLDKWLTSIWLLANSKNGVSSHELGRAVGLTQKSAWFVLQRVRLAMQTKSFDPFTGEVEVDETFVGGKVGNMHKSVRARKSLGGGVANKAIVAGALERGGAVRAQVVPDTSRRTLEGHVSRHVLYGSTVYSDAHAGYGRLSQNYTHATIDHAVRYVDGRVHTNGIENFWALLKRGLHGTYVSVAPEHLFRYLDERVFTFNLRDLTDLGRFTAVLSAVSGRRLTYAELTA
jgi:transposase-like protein